MVCTVGSFIIDHNKHIQNVFFLSILSGISYLFLRTVQMLVLKFKIQISDYV